MALQLQFRHDCQNLGCANKACNLCKLCQRRRCPTNFGSKYLAPCDVVEAKCGAQIYVVVQDAATGDTVTQGLEELAILISIIDGRRFEAEAAEGHDLDEVLERCELLENKQKQPLLAHGRSGSHTDTKRVLVPMIQGQALLPDLKITDSSEALLTGRAPPFRLAVRAVHRSGEPFEGVAFALSEPFVVATARVKGAAKTEIPHVDDHVSKIDCVGLQTQKKLEDIKAAAETAGVPDLNLPINSVVKVGQFRDLVEAAERNKALRETLKQVLRLTKGWDVAKEHVRKAVETDVQLRVYHPDGRTEVGLVFKCGSFNTIDINHPVGLMRRKQNPQQPNQEMVDVIWLPLDTASFPDAVKRMLPQAHNDWKKEGHNGWALLPLTTNHMPPFTEGGKPTTQTSAFTFTIRAAPGGAAGSAGAGAAPPRSPRAGHAPGTAAAPGASSATSAPGGQAPPLMGSAGSGPSGMNGFAPSSSGAGAGGGPPMGLELPGLGGGLGGPILRMPSPLQGPPPQQHLPGSFLSDPQLGALRLPQQQQQQQQQRGLGSGLPAHFSPGGALGGMLFGGQQQAQPVTGPMQQAQQQAQQQQQQQYGGMTTLPDLPPALMGLDAGMLQSLVQIPALDMYNAVGGTPMHDAAAAAAAAAQRGSQPPALQQQRQQAQQQQAQQGPALPPELANLLKEESLSPFEDPNFQQLMSMVAANGPPSGAGANGARGAAPRSGGREKAAKRKADTSLETWMDMNKNLDLDMSMPTQQVGPLESLFTSLLPSGGDLGSSGGAAPAPVGFFPAMPSGEPGGPPAPANDGRAEGDLRERKPKSPRAEAGAAGGGERDGVKSEQVSQQQQQQPAASSGGAAPMDVQQSSESTARGSGGAAAADAGASSAQQQEAAPAAAEVRSAHPSQQQQQPAVAPAPAPLVTSVTLEDMQAQFARAMRQEITFAELETFLKRNNLLPSGQSAGGGAAAAFAAAAGAGVATAAQFGKDMSGGLEDMQTIEQALPSGSDLRL